MSALTKLRVKPCAVFSTLKALLGLFAVLAGVLLTLEGKTARALSPLGKGPGMGALSGALLALVFGAPAGSALLKAG
jgi:hypothetical protein